MKIFYVLQLSFLIRHEKTRGGAESSERRETSPSTAIPLWHHIPYTGTGRGRVKVHPIFLMLGKTHGKIAAVFNERRQQNPLYITAPSPFTWTQWYPDLYRLSLNLKEPQMLSQPGIPQGTKQKTHPGKKENPREIQWLQHKMQKGGHALKTVSNLTLFSW